MAKLLQILWLWRPTLIGIATTSFLLFLGIVLPAKVQDNVAAIVTLDVCHKVRAGMTVDEVAAVIQIPATEVRRYGTGVEAVTQFRWDGNGFKFCVVFNANQKVMRAISYAGC